MIFKLPFTATFFLALSLFCFLSTPLYSQPGTPEWDAWICMRTPAIRDAIVDAIIPDNCSMRSSTADFLLAGITDLTVDGLTATPVSGDFSGLTGLTSLSLTNGDFTDSPFPLDIFSDLGSLRSLDLSGGSFTELPSGIFSDLVSLTSLNLGDGSFTTSLSSDIFSDLGSSLRSLDLSGGNFTTLPSNIFSALTGITTLNLSGGSFTTLPPDIFSGLGTLTELDLSGGNFTTIPSDIFSGLGALTELDLRDGNSTTLPSDIFSGLGSLMRLDLSNGNFTTLPSDIFSGLGSLTSLNLRDGNFTTLPADIFSGLGSLTNIRFLGTDGNTCALVGLAAGTFLGLTSLEVINMDNCSLTLAGLPVDIFDGLNSLEQIRMSGNVDLEGVRIPVRLVRDVSDTLTRLDLPPDVIHEVGLSTPYTTVSEGAAVVSLRAFSTYSSIDGFTVDIATAGDALLGTDYTLDSSIINVVIRGASDRTPPFEGTVGIDPIVDTVAEMDETIIVSITSVTVLGDYPGVTLEEQFGGAEVTITLVDGLPQAFLTVEDHIVANGVEEGEPFVLSIRLTEPLDSDVWLRLNTTSFSDMGIGFHMPVGEDVGVMIPAGDILATRVLIAEDDTEAELEQVVHIEFDTSPSSFGFARNQVDEGEPNFLDIRIPANDFNVQLELSSTSIREGGVEEEGGSFATLSFGVSFRSRFSLTIDQLSGSATEPPHAEQDYTLGQTLFEFSGVGGDGDPRRTGSTTITVVDDTVRELVEDLQLSGSVTVGEVVVSLPITDGDGSTATLEIQDNEGPEVIVQTPADLVSWEDGRDSPALPVGGPSALTVPSNQFTVVLGANPLPGKVVVICMSATADSGGMDQGFPDPDCVSFGESDWSVPQTVTMVSGNDAIDEGASDADGQRSYMVNFDLSGTSGRMTTDGGYSALTLSPLSVIDIDDDTAGIVVEDSDMSYPSDLSTTEDATVAIYPFFRVSLESQPTHDVTITITSSDSGEGLLGIFGGSDSPAGVLTLTFTPDHDPLDDGYILEVSGQDDAVDDGDQMYELTFTVSSADALYGNVVSVPVPILIQVTNTDDDTAGITLDDFTGNPVADLVTFEDGSGDSVFFIVHLDSEPTAAVTITITSTNPEEGSLVSPEVSFSLLPELTLVFTSDLDSWFDGHSVELFGLDDAVDDGDQMYELTFAVSSADVLYMDATRVPVPTTIQVINTDDDTAGIGVSQTTSVDSRLRTGEDGTSVNFDIVLVTQPTSDVVLVVTSDSPDEGVVSKTSSGSGATSIEFTFTSTDWNTLQTVYIFGVDDDLIDVAGDYTVTVEVKTALTARDDGYDGASAQNVYVFNRDDEIDAIPGIFILPDTSGSRLVTFEEGGHEPTFFEVVLEAAPTGDVVLVVTSGLTQAGLVSKTSSGSPAPMESIQLTFGAGTWNVGQKVYVTGVDDDIAVEGGSRDYTVTVAVDMDGTADDRYDALGSQDVLLRTIDDDTAMIVVASTSASLTTGEDATIAPASMEVSLGSEPTLAVTVTITTSAADEGGLLIADDSPIASSVTLMFDSTDWSTPVEVRVKGVDDDIDDGDQTYQLTFAVTTTDVVYNALLPAPIEYTNVDDDTAGIGVSETTSMDDRLETREDGTTVEFNIVLTTEPTSDVVLVVTSDSPDEGVVSKTSSGSGATSSEFTFTSTDWATPQTIYILGFDDSDLDGDVEYTVTVAVKTATTRDDGYDGVSVQNIYVLNKDDELPPGIAISPDTGDTRLVTFEEAGREPASFEVVLVGVPTGAVELVVTSGLPEAGLVSTTSSGSPAPMESIRLIFDTTTWNVAQDVYVTGVDDDIAVEGGFRDYTVTVAVDTDGTADDRYDALESQEVLLRNTDDDTAMIIVASTSASLTTGEDVLAEVASLEVSLGSEPMEEVSVKITTSSPDESQLLIFGGSPAALPSVTLTFNSLNYSETKRVLVDGVDDDVDDGDQTYQLTFTVITTDPVYDDVALVPSTIEYTNVDDDTAGIGVSETTGTNARLDTGEDGTTVEFDISLTTEPTSDVVLVVTSDSPDEGVVSAGSSGTGAPSIEFTFVLASWDTSQTVYIQGIDDDDVDGDVEYTVTVAVNTGGATRDDGYDGVPAQNIYVLNGDDETTPATPGLTISPASDATSRLDTSEDGTSPAVFTVVLNTQPTGAVVLVVTSGSPGEGLVSATVSPGTGANSIELNFDAANWDMAQEVYVLGVDDDASAGPVDFIVTVGVDAAGTADTDYDALASSPMSVFLRKTDDDASASLVPDAPRGLRAISSLGSTTIELSWDPPVSDGGSVITGYRIESSSSGSAPWTEVATTMGLLP